MPSSKAGGPLLERIDLHVRAEPLSVAEWSDDRPPAETSATIRERVIEARQLQVDVTPIYPESTATPVSRSRS